MLQDGSINFVEGTSFATPAVSGAAAAIIGGVRRGSVTATEVRNALIESANPSRLRDGSDPIDQGHGFVDVKAALKRLRSGDEDSEMTENDAGNSVAANIRELGFKPIQFDDNNMFASP